jgi:predicted nuclease of predicted toxin-antitoxin system
VNFKLDENLPVELAADLRGMGHDTDTVASEGLRGAADWTVVKAASDADRILLTLDKGIADARREGHAGVVLFRPPSSGRGAVRAFIRERIQDLIGIELAGRLTVVGQSRIRFR